MDELKKQLDEGNRLLQQIDLFLVKKEVYSINPNREINVLYVSLHKEITRHEILNDPDFVFPDNKEEFYSFYYSMNTFLEYKPDHYKALFIEENRNKDFIIQNGLWAEKEYDFEEDDIDEEFMVDNDED